MTDTGAEEVSAYSSAGGKPVRTLASFLPNALDAKPDPEPTIVLEEPAATAKTLLELDDWEQRLAEARVKRERVLAKKQAKPKKPKSNKPLFAYDPDFLRNETENCQPSDNSPNPFANKAEKQRSPITARTAPKVMGSNPDWFEDEMRRPPAPQRQPRSSISLATASAFGIGVGLSLGMLLMAGINNLNRTPAAPETASVAPEALAPQMSLLQNPAVPDPEMLVSRAAIAPLPEPFMARVAPAPEVASDVLTAQTALFLGNPQPFDTAPVAHASVADAPFKLASVSHQKLLSDAQPVAFVLRSEELQENTFVAALAIDMNASGIGIEPSPTTLFFEGTKRAEIATVVPVLFDPAPSVNGFGQLPLMDATPLSVRAVTRPPALTAPDNIPKAAAFGFARPQDSAPQAALSLRASITPQPDTLPFVGKPPERDLTLAETLGVVGERAQNVRLFVHAPTSIEKDALDTKLNTFLDTGFAVAKVNRENFKISRTHIRYYTQQDEKYAQALAADLGIQARSFVKTGGDSGRIEIWMEGRGAGRVASTTKRAQPRRAQTADPALQLRNSLIKKLRRGDHL